MSGVAERMATEEERLEDMFDSDRVTDDSLDEEETETAVSELDRGSKFWLGTSTRFGRQVRINSRLISWQVFINISYVSWERLQQIWMF